MCPPAVGTSVIIPGGLYGEKEDLLTARNEGRDMEPKVSSSLSLAVVIFSPSSTAKKAKRRRDHGSLMSHRLAGRRFPIFWFASQSSTPCEISSSLYHFYC